MRGQKHLGKQEVQRIISEVSERSRQNKRRDADVTRVYEDLKGMVYDDTSRRRPVLGVIILSNHYQIDAFPQKNMSVSKRSGSATSKSRRRPSTSAS